MGKKKRLVIPDEQHLCLPPHPQATSQATPIVDTHTHLLSTFSKYRSVYPSAKHQDIFAFVRELYGAVEGKCSHDISPKHKTAAIVDVWCEAPVTKEWKEMADSALDATARREMWGGVEYWFVMGACGCLSLVMVRYSCFWKVFIRTAFYLTSATICHVQRGLPRHEAKLYTDEVERDMYVALSPPAPSHSPSA